MDDTPDPKDVPPPVKSRGDKTAVDIDPGHPRDGSGPDASDAPEEHGSATRP